MTLRTFFYPPHFFSRSPGHFPSPSPGQILSLPGHFPSFLATLPLPFLATFLLPLLVTFPFTLLATFPPSPGHFLSHSWLLSLSLLASLHLHLLLPDLSTSLTHYSGQGLGGWACDGRGVFEGEAGCWDLREGSQGKDGVREEEDRERRK